MLSLDIPVYRTRHPAVNIGIRLALVKNFDITEDVTYRDYKKFRSDASVVPSAQHSNSP